MICVSSPRWPAANARTDPRPGRGTPNSMNNGTPSDISRAEQEVLPLLGAHEHSVHHLHGPPPHANRCRDVPRTPLCPEQQPRETWRGEYKASDAAPTVLGGFGRYAQEPSFVIG